MLSEIAPSARDCASMPVTAEVKAPLKLMVSSCQSSRRASSFLLTQTSCHSITQHLQRFPALGAEPEGAACRVRGKFCRAAFSSVRTKENRRPEGRRLGRRATTVTVLIGDPGDLRERFADAADKERRRAVAEVDRTDLAICVQSRLNC